MPTESKHPETIVLHAGYRSDPATNAVAVPIYQTTSYQFRDTEHAANLFGLKELGNIYTRIMNPTSDVLEQRVAALEGGVAALALGSGQAASMFCVNNIAQAGDNFVSSTDLYGGTWNLFLHTMQRTMGIEVRFVDPSDPENFRRATDAKTRCYYAETLPNPKLEVFPIGEVARIGREMGVPLIVDNTAAPVLCRPIEHGAAIVMHSTTKYIGGHGTSIGGIVVDGGNFDWEKHADRFPLLNQPDPAYHGAVWTAGREADGAGRLHHQDARHPAARPRRGREPVQLVPAHPGAGDAGAQDAGALRQCRGSGELPEGPSESQPGHPSEPDGGRTAAPRRRLSEGRLWRALGLRAEGWARCRAALHRRAADVLPCREYRRRAQPRDPSGLTTHSQLTPEEQLQTGVTDGYVRLSIGIEHEDDILADLRQALDKA